MFDPRLDLAVREWSRRSPKIRALVDSEDNQRIEALRQFYLRFDYAMPEALIRARGFVFFADWILRAQCPGVAEYSLDLYRSLF